MTANCKSLPVAMYHYVNEYAGSITVSPDRFEEHCRSLAEDGWRGVGLAEAEEYFLNGEPLPAKSLLITFDDGFLDNAMYALPLLNRHGHRAVTFAVSNRLEPGGPPRFSLEDVLAGRCVAPEGVRRPLRHSPQGFSLREDVFMNHAEARMLHAQGCLSIASHSRGHYGVFVNSEYKDFLRPGDQFRTFYRAEEEPIWGMPQFTVLAGLKFRAFVPDPEMVEAIKRLVPQDVDGAVEFFAREANVRQLERLCGSYAGKMGRFETDPERRDRMWREIAGGKEELESILGRETRTLCWPWGYYCEEAFELARAAGFQIFFTTREGVNPPGRPDAIHRFKAKDKSGDWLRQRAFIYSRPLLGRLYAAMRI
jgi:peptidoglycan/xylan/chitin deacetylase (PgdA/CDA1 family)